MIAATVLMFFSFSALITALADTDAEDAVRTASLAVGLAIVPFVFIVLAFGSRHPRAPRAVLGSLAIWALIGVSIGWFSFALALVLAYGVGGMISLRADDPRALRARMLSLLLAVVYVVVLIALVSPGIGVFAAAVLPLLALAFADQYLEVRARRPPGDPDWA